jgi:hypothetical protein
MPHGPYEKGDAVANLGDSLRCRTGLGTLSFAVSGLTSRRFEYRLLAGGSEMSSQDLEYYRERARTERALADAYQGKAADVHLELAKRYEALVAEIETPGAGTAPRA